MSRELDRVRALRPATPGPTSVARDRALARLTAAIEDEPTGLHAGRHPRGRRIPTVGERTRRGRRRTVHGRLRPPAAPAGAPSGGRLGSFGRLGSGGWLGSLAVVATAVAVALGAIVLLGHHGRARPAPGTTAASGAPGAVLAADDHALAGPGAEALRHEYATALAAGDALHTTVDPSLQHVAVRALRHSIAAQHALGGAFVAMNADTGAIDAISGARGVIASAGAVGSTFAPITALAALQAGVWSMTERYDDTGRLCGVVPVCLHNAEDAAYGVLDLTRALAVEDSLFFAHLGVALDHSGGDASAGTPLDRWAALLDVGRRTGIDLPGEASGRLPTPAWRRQTDGRRRAAIDDVELAVGAGDVALTPVQLAVAYAAIANGGTVLTPHLGRTLTRGSRIVRTIDPAPRGTLRLGVAGLAAVRAGMRANTASPGGVDSSVFRGLPAPVAGLAGTVQRLAGGREVDDAWYAGYVPTYHGHPPLVVVVRVPGGGFGGVAAAPVAREIFAQWLTGKAGRFVPGTSRAQ